MKVAAKWKLIYKGTLYFPGDTFTMEQKDFEGAFKKDVTIVSEKKTKKSSPKKNVTTASQKKTSKYSNKKMSSK